MERQTNQELAPLVNPGDRGNPGEAEQAATAGNQPAKSPGAPDEYLLA
jgi:hypothetical protein